MAEAEEKKEAEGTQAAPPAGKSKKKLIIIGAIVAVVLIVSGIVAGILLSRDNSKSLAPDAALEADETGGLVEEGVGDEEAVDEGLETLGAIYPLESFLVNLTGGGFIRIQIQVEFVGRTVSKRFQVKLVPIRDGIIQLLSSRRREELLNKEGKENLKADLTTLINETLGRNDIKNMYFTNFVIQ